MISSLEEKYLYNVALLISICLADVVDARDVAKAMLSAVKNGQRNEQYLLSAAHVSIEDICRTLEQVTGIQAPTRRVPTAMIYTVAWISERIASLTKRDAELTLDAIRVLTNKSRTSSAKAVKQLGVTFRPLEETMRDTAQWFMANG
jgi:dihydroflavonol-4-reductase